MIYIYFFIKCVVRGSENSVRFENLMGNWLPDGPNSVRFYLTVWDMACMQSSENSLISESMSVVISLIYNENNTGPRTVPWGTPDKTGAQSDFIPFTTTRCCLKQRKQSIHFSLCTNTIPIQLAFRQFMRGCIKSFLKVQDECVNLSAVIQDFSPVIYNSDQQSFTAVPLSECMLTIWQMFMFV